MKALVLIISLQISLLSISQSYSKCKILTNDEGLIQLSNLGIPVDHGVRKKNTFFISDFSSIEIEKMRQNGFQVEIIIEDVQAFYRNQNREMGITRNETCLSSASPIVPNNFTLGSMGGFFTYEEFIAHLDLMASLYPNLITVKDTIGNYVSHENRPIYWVKISDQANTDEAEPEVLYSAIHHAREPESLSSTIYYMWYLLENYASDPEIKFLVDETEMYFVPMVNPDGYKYNQTIEPNGGGMWRKNRKVNSNGTFGVDLNRNYSYGWGTTGISFDPSSDTYPGTGAFSEPETQAMKWFCEQRDFYFAFNAHSHGNLLLFPIGAQINEFAEDHDYFLSVSTYMVQNSTFIAQKASDLYPASGDSDDYMYLDDLSIKSEIFAFTPEIGTDSDGFWPVSDRIIPLSQEMFFPNLMLAHATHNYWAVNETDNQSITQTTGVFNHQVQRIGLEDTPLVVSIEPIAGIQSVGNPLNYTLPINGTSSGSINYTLLSSMQLGQEIKYVLVSDFGAYQNRDTIIKNFGNPSLLVLDDASTIDNWTGNWDLTTEDFTSSDYSFTDSPNSNYANNASKTINYIPTLDLRQATAAKVEFSAKWSIEDNYDYAAFEISIDSGVTWIPQCGKYTNMGTSASQSAQPNLKPIYDGTQSSWVLEEISLNDYLGQNVNLRFVFGADQGLTEDGFYFDDFKIYTNGGSTFYNSINEISTGEQINLFPNPVTNHLTVSLPNFVNDLQIEILDLNGKVILSKNEIGNFNLIMVPIDMIEAGSYIINFRIDNKQQHTKKLVVIK